MRAAGPAHGHSPTVKLKSASFGHVTGQLDLIVAGGEVSKLAMEMAGLHILEIVV